MTKEFKILAASVMHEHGETFSKQNKEQIGVVLAPLREKLTEFEVGLAAAHAESLKERAILAEQVKQLSQASSTMTSETSNLTRALKGKAQTQGAWGEMILATILEKSGLRPGEEYLTQACQTTGDGQRLRPDVIVNLPGGQRIVIDAKVSLNAFEAYVNAGSDEDRAVHLQRHLTSIRTHIKALGDKAYQVYTNGGVDYVIMFVPIEGALAIALQEAPNITSEAVAQNVSLATPTTLMIALRTAASVWQVERRNLNAELIAERAGQLYDKFVGFIEDMKAIGKRLDQTPMATLWVSSPPAAEIWCVRPIS
jgi:DNA recombination protein RmuC